MPCGGQQTVMERAKQTMKYVHCRLEQLKEDMQLQRPQPNLCPCEPQPTIICPNPCKQKPKVCRVRVSKCADLKPSWLCGSDLDKYIANQEYEGPYRPETKILKKHLENNASCPSGGICGCSLDNPCPICVMESLKNLIDILSDGEGCGGSCPPPCPKPCCKPCTCGPDIIDKCLIQLCPATPFSPANKCWLVQRGQCMINFAKQKYVAPFCTRPEELLPSQCGQGWIIERKCEPAKRKPEFQFDPYDPFILHDKTCSAKKGAKKPTKKK